MRMSFHPAVRREAEDACAWYDERKDGLGDEFFQELERVLERIGENPKAFPRASAGRRKAHLKRLPYAAYYRVLADRVRILAVVHDRRHPLQGSRRK